MAANTISCKAWNSPVEYPCREYKHDIKESKGNMFNPKLEENVQGWKYPGSCACAEPKPLTESQNIQFKMKKMATVWYDNICIVYVVWKNKVIQIYFFEYHRSATNIHSSTLLLDCECVYQTVNVPAVVTILATQFPSVDENNQWKYPIILPLQVFYHIECHGVWEAIIYSRKLFSGQSMWYHT